MADDLLLIRKLQAGEMEALGTLFERYSTAVYRTALAITRDERAAEDILQECFLRMYTYAASIDPKRPLRPWLYRVTVNLAYDHAQCCTQACPPAGRCIGVAKHPDQCVSGARSPC